MALFKWVLLVCCCVFLSGCDFDDPDFYYFHPKVLNHVLKSCQAHSDSTSERCVAAYEAGRQLNFYIRKFAQDQEAFGKAIIDTEIELSKVEQQLADGKASSELEDRKQALELERDKLLFIVGWYASPV